MMIAAEAANPAATIAERWDAIWGAGAYREVVEAAKKLGYKTPAFSWTQVARALFLPVAIFWPYNAIPVAGEISMPRKSALIGSLGSGIALAIIGTLVAWAFEYSYGEFGAMYMYVLMKGGAKLLTKTPILPIQYPIFGSLLFAHIPPIAAFLAALPTISNFGRLPSSFYWTTRPAFALAMDRFGPEIFAHISRFHSPTYSILFCAVVGSIMVAVTAMAPWVAAVSLFLVFVFARLLIFGLSPTVLPFTRPYIWEQGLRLTIAGFPLMSILGLIHSAFFTYVFLTAAMTMKIESAYAFMISMGIGLIPFLYYAHRNKKLGIDINKIFTELPPE